MGLILMIILFAVGIIATGVMIYRRVGKNKAGPNDPEAGSRPGTGGTQPLDPDTRTSH
jgi:hypothetical protein